jgi:arginase
MRLLGAPIDLGSGGKGSAEGPAALRAADLAGALGRRGHVVTDGGDIAGLSNTPGRMIDGCRSLQEVAAGCRLIRDGVAAALADGEVPVLLGGDHSLSIGSIAAVAGHCGVAGKPLFVLWLDAHADFNTPDSSPSGLLYGMPVAVVAGEGHRTLLGVGTAAPRVDLSRMALVGVRSIDPLEEVRIRERSLRVHTMREVRSHGMQAVVAMVLAEARRMGGHLHVSFDVDFLDPSLAPGVGLAEPGGLDLAEAEACMAAIAAAGGPDSFDLMELSPAHDWSGATARHVVDLVASAFPRV